MSGFNNISSEYYETEFNPRVVYPFLEWSLAPGYKLHLGSPSGFLFGELNATAKTTFVYNNKIEVDLAYIFPLYNNYNELGYFADPSDNLYPLRVNIQDYLKQGTEGPEILQVSYQDSIGDHYFLGLIGNMELMLGGVHFEYLYRKTNSPFAIGADISHVQQRSFEKSFFKYQRYNSNLYNLNTYFYEDNLDLQFKLSYGKYLAKDVGYTFEVARKFRNGFTVGVFLQEPIFQLENLVKVLLIRVYSFQCQLICSLLKTTEEDHLVMDIGLLQEMVDLNLEQQKTFSQLQPLNLSTTINKSFLNVSYRPNIL